MYSDYTPYPSYDAQRPRRLLGMLGSFWAFIYSGRASVQELLGARGALAEQTYQNLLESWLSISRLTTPPLHRERWYPWVIRRSAAQDGYARFGDQGVTFNGDPQRLFGWPVTAEPLTWTAPAGFLTAAAVCDGLRTPALLWTRGIDFVVEPPTTVASARVHFRVNPFRRDDFARADLTDGDQELTVWLHLADFDTNRLAEHWWYVLGVNRSAPTEASKATFNAIYDALVGGSAFEQVRRALVSLTGIPLAATDSETVERIDTFNGLLWLLTDKNAYAYLSAANPTVAIGDTVVAGQPLTDALELGEVNDGEVPGGWTGLALGEDYLAFPAAGELIFDAEDIPWEGEEIDGKLRLSCALGGNPLDAETFWDEVHERGLASGQTLAELLDRRPEESRVTPAALENLLPTVNPLQFLVQNLLRFNTIFARVRAACLRTRGAAGLLREDLLRKMLPPETALLLQLELPPVEEQVTIVDGAFAVGVAPEPHAEVFAGGSHRGVAKAFSGTCQ